MVLSPGTPINANMDQSPKNSQNFLCPPCVPEGKKRPKTFGNRGMALKFCFQCVENNLRNSGPTVWTNAFEWGALERA